MAGLWTTDDFNLSTDAANGKLGFIHPDAQAHVGFHDTGDISGQAQNLAGGWIQAVRSGQSVTWYFQDLDALNAGTNQLFTSGEVDPQLRPETVLVEPILDDAAANDGAAIVVTGGGAITLRNAVPGTKYRGHVTFVTTAGWWPSGTTPMSVSIEAV